MRLIFVAAATGKARPMGTLSASTSLIPCPFFHPLFDSSFQQPPVHGITGNESGDHSNLHHEPEFDHIRFNMRAEPASENNELRDGHTRTCQSATL
jgi:hypothetical protein